MQKLLLLLYLIHQSSGVLYSMNLTEYYKMPELNDMDDFDPCLVAPGGLYCVLDADLYPGDNPDLMRTIREYSDYKKKHYNHTQIHRALCVTETCKDFIHGRDLENETDLQSTLEECVNASIWRSHKLTARLTNISTCKKHGAKRQINTGDYIMAAVYLIFIILNTLGTLHDLIKGDTPGNPYLLAFSVRRNWRKLTAPSSVGPDHRLRRLRAFNGLRSLTIFGVYTTHTALVMAFSFLKNPIYFETAYDDPIKNMLVNGDVVTYTFFVMSGFLVAFNMELLAEKTKITLWEWPRSMALRWLRLTPVLMIVLFTVMTLNRHFADGPQWDLFVTVEAEACHKYWWTHLLYINNYIYDNSHCLPQTWYLAADTQLFALGLLVCVSCRRARTQATALAVLAVASLASPAAHTYFQDLDAVVYQSPELYRSLYKTYDTFRIMYVRSHTNMFTYVLGIAGGLLAFRWLEDEKNVSEKFQKYRWVIWLAVPIAAFNVFSGTFFYIDGYEPSTAVRVLYATLRKPIFQVCTLVFIMGSIFKAEGILRGILEWRGFTWTARVSYSAFLLHTIVQRGMVGSQKVPIFMSDYYLIMILGGTTFVTTTAAAVLWVTVESPIAMLIKTALLPKKEPPPVEETTKV